MTTGAPATGVRLPTSYGILALRVWASRVRDAGALR